MIRTETPIHYGRTVRPVAWTCNVDRTLDSDWTGTERGTESVRVWAATEADARAAAAAEVAAESSGTVTVHSVTVLSRG